MMIDVGDAGDLLSEVNGFPELQAASVMATPTAAIPAMIARLVCCAVIAFLLLV